MYNLHKDNETLLTTCTDSTILSTIWEAKQNNNYLPMYGTLPCFTILMSLVGIGSNSYGATYRLVYNPIHAY